MILDFFSGLFCSLRDRLVPTFPPLVDPLPGRREGFALIPAYHNQFSFQRIAKLRRRDFFNLFRPEDCREDISGCYIVFSRLPEPKRSCIQKQKMYTTNVTADTAVASK
jgi:hypothetical protein